MLAIGRCNRFLSVRGKHAFGCALHRSGTAGLGAPFRAQWIPRVACLSSTVNPGSLTIHPRFQRVNETLESRQERLKIDVVVARWIFSRVSEVVILIGCLIHYLLYVSL